MELIHELMQQYSAAADYEVEPVPFGMTNVTKIIRTGDQRAIARVYDPQTKDQARLAFEIELTAYLQQRELSFEVPCFLPSLKGDFHVELSGGQLGAMVRFIDGRPPDLSNMAHVQAMGSAAGQLSEALQRFVPPLAMPPGVQFHRLQSLHPLSGPEAVARFIADPPFAIPAEGSSAATELLTEIDRHGNELERLPMQIVHHDLLVYNLLIGEDGRMNGVLDFDFASWDVRAFELAACLNHLLQHHTADMKAIASFMESFAAYVTLQEEEIGQLPLLMRIYYASLLTIYIGQHAAGRDVQAPFLYICEQLCQLIRWQASNGERFSQLIHEVNGSQGQ